MPDVGDEPSGIVQGADQYPPNQQEWHLKDQDECEDEQDYVECQQRRTAMVGTRPPDQQAAGAGNHCQEGELDGCSPCGEQSVKLASFQVGCEISLNIGDDSECHSTPYERRPFEQALVCYARQAQLQLYIRPLLQPDELRALMKSADSRLIPLTSSKLLTLIRLSESRSDL